MLTDNEVILLRRRASEGNPVNQVQYAKERGLDSETIGKAIRGLSFKHLNPVQPPVVMRNRKDDLRLKARKLYQDKKTYNEIVDILGVSKSSVSNWCRDLVDHKNHRVKTSTLSDKKKEARRLYRDEKMTCPQITNLLGGVSNSTVSKWCKDLSRERRSNNQLIRRRQTEEEREKNRLIKPRHSILSNETVINLRRRAKEEGHVSAVEWGKDHKVSPPTVSYAVRGKTFSHLDHLESPFTDDMEKVKIKKKKVTSFASEETIAQAIKNRREDPNTWDYAALAKWFSEQTGKVYQGGNVAVLLRKRDPDMKEFDKIHRKPKRRYPSKSEGIKKYPKQRKTMTAQEIALKRQADASLRKAIAAADRHEAWVNAGCPADWVEYQES